MVSEYLIKESQRLQQEIAALKAAGLAPEECWLSPSYRDRGGTNERIYYRVNYKVNSGGGKTETTTEYLGRAGCEKHQSWEARIDRRNQCSELEQQLQMLQELIARQDKHDEERAITLGKQAKERAEALGQDSPVSEDMGSMYQPGDRFVWESRCYEVVKAGRQNLGLKDCEGRGCTFIGRDHEIRYATRAAA